MKKEAKKGPKTIPILTKDKKNPTQDHKIPFFRVPTFQRDTLQGDTFIEGVNRSFCSTAMARYLESMTYCDNNPCWSGALARRIRESIVFSEILSFLATELKREKKLSPRLAESNQSLDYEWYNHITIHVTLEDFVQLEMRVKG